jgi:hypothetical protein
LQKYRGKGNYDCLVPVSGGKDSMYVLYMMAAVYKLKVLAYNFDNGFQSEKAMQNIKRAVKKLGVDLIIYKPKENVLYDLYRIFLVRAGEFCTPCNMLITTASHRIARQNRIPLIMNGGSDTRSSGIAGMSMSSYCDRRYYMNVVAGAIDKKTVKPYVMYSPFEHAIRRLTRTGPDSIEVLSYLHPGTLELETALKQELGWESPSDELEHGDCKLNPLKDYLMNRKWGCSELTQAYSSLVRHGELTREDALQRAEAEEVRNPPSILPTFLEKTGITPEEFVASKSRHFTDYPNFKASTLYKLGKKAFRFVYGSR